MRYAWLFLWAMLSSTAQAGGTEFSVAIFKNSACSGTPAGEIAMPTGTACVNYSYTDSKGLKTLGSNGNIRCYPDKVVFDKYPLVKDCPQNAKIIERDHKLSADPKTCLRAPSHEGDVFEKLLGYTYPGNENCMKAANPAAR